MRRALFIAVAIAACGWGLLLAIYAVLAEQIFTQNPEVTHPFLSGPLPFLSARERSGAIILAMALGLLSATALPLALSRNGKNRTAFVVVCCGLVALSMAGFVTVLWQPWDFPYCWICP